MPLVNDVTGLNPVEVASVVAPGSVEEMAAILRDRHGPVSIGGGRYSMGGHTAVAKTLHLDLRSLNRILWFEPAKRLIRVQAGVRWHDIQTLLDPAGLAVKIMQTYANFTVGGALSVNCHGRYIGFGPVILSVKEILVVGAAGQCWTANRETNSEIFFAAIGGYGAIGIIAEAELELVDNVPVERQDVRLSAQEYPEYFSRKVRDDRAVIFHNADLYAPHFRRARAVSWVATGKAPTVSSRLQKVRPWYPVHRYFLWAMTETPFGMWRRERIVDPVVYARPKVHWRNFEAGYRVEELEPRSRRRTTYVLQEYFIPVGRYREFLSSLQRILRSHRVNMLNVSVRHAFADPGSLLAWAREEVFAFVLYYKQRTNAAARAHVGHWTRELIDAALDAGGTYYLPYQAHATAAQFHRAYPGARALFALKRQLDPEYRFRNPLWEKYYAPTLNMTSIQTSDFHRVYDDEATRRRFFGFLQHIFHLYPEDLLHEAILEACRRHADDKSIYADVQAQLPRIKPFLSELTHALPALRRQKAEMTRETMALLGDRREFDGYAEIGSTGRYISELRRQLRVSGPIYLINDVAPTYGPADVMERGRIRKLGKYVDLAGYRPIAGAQIPDQSIDLLTCYIGLHHVEPDRLDAFVASLRRILRPGALFVFRDHDVANEEMAAFVRLAHTVFDLGLGVAWEKTDADPNHFRTASAWSEFFARSGFRDLGARELQPNDPTLNTLMAFVRT